MIVRIFAWIAVIFGVAIAAESTFVAHQPNWVWIGILVLGLAYFAKNGFLRPKRESERSVDR